MLSYYFMEQKEREEFGKETSRFDEMLEPYRKAFMLGDLQQQHSIVNDFASSLLLAEASKLADERTSAGCFVPEDKSLEDILTCTLCQELFHVPVTLPCGHTFCSDCLASSGHSQQSICPSCGQTSSLQCTSNIAIQELMLMWLPEKTYIRVCMNEAGKLLDERKIQEFMNFVEKTLSQLPDNVEFLCLRAHGYKCLKSYNEALRDLDLAYSLAPFSGKIVQERGELLACMERTEEAMSMYLRAAALRPDKYRCSLTLYLEKLLRNICDSPVPCPQSMSPSSKYVEHESSVNFGTNAVKKLPTKCKPNTVTEQASRQVFVAESQIPPGKHNEKGDEVLDDKESCFKQDESAKHNTKQTTTFQTNTVTTLPKSNIPEELECKLCFNLIYDPVTTNCGHSLCRSCLRRCLDHRLDCPYCRTSLQSFLERLMNGNIGTCEVLEKILLLKFEQDYELRRIAFENELLKFSRCESSTDEIPIFVCTMAVPGIPCPLHIFEPRYKLMVRRCLESGSRQFGMCVSDPEHGFATVGTMLYINDANFLPDGRSIIKTVGSRRFRVLERGVLDGYNTAKVEWLEDEVEEQDYTTLNSEVYTMMTQWLDKLTSEQQQCIVRAVGPLPDEGRVITKNGPHWLWWLLAALPLNVEAKSIILSMTSVTERLNSAKRFLAILLSRL